MDLTELREPFPATDIEWRIGRAGKNNRGIWAMCLAYVTNRAIMQRLDDVCGPGNWRNEYTAAPCGGILCGISIKVDGEWVTKWDGAENTDIEAVKGGLSGAMKRAAVQWGIGRYLYGLDEGFADISADKGPGMNFARLKKEDGGDVFYWKPPALPAWALPPTKTPKEAADALRTLTKDMGDEIKAETEKRIKAGMTKPEARAYYQELEKRQAA